MTFKRRSKSKKKGFILFILILLAWGAYEVLPIITHKTDPLYLLYDVSRFQAELVAHQLNGATQSKTTEDLDSLLQALYAFRYAHSNLSEATKLEVPLLHSDTVLIDMIFRWQLGGNRDFSEGEMDLLKAVAADYANLFNYYQKLMEGSSVNGAFVSRISEMDSAIVKKIQKNSGIKKEIGN
jgi:hypothetical protein